MIRSLCVIIVMVTNPPLLRKKSAPRLPASHCHHNYANARQPMSLTALPRPSKHRLLSKPHPSLATKLVLILTRRTESLALRCQRVRLLHRQRRPGPQSCAGLLHEIRCLRRLQQPDQRLLVDGRRLVAKLCSLRQIQHARFRFEPGRRRRRLSGRLARRHNLFRYSFYSLANAGFGKQILTDTLSVGAQKIWKLSQDSSCSLACLPIPVWKPSPPSPSAMNTPPSAAGHCASRETHSPAHGPCWLSRQQRQ